MFCSLVAAGCSNRTRRAVRQRVFSVCLCNYWLHLLATRPSHTNIYSPARVIAPALHRSAPPPPTYRPMHRLYGRLENGFVFHNTWATWKINVIHDLQYKHIKYIKCNFIEFVTHSCWMHFKIIWFVECRSLGGCHLTRVISLATIFPNFALKAILSTCSTFAARSILHPSGT